MTARSNRKVVNLTKKGSPINFRDIENQNPIEKEEIIPILEEVIPILKEVITELEKEREEKQRLWCTKCDVDMVKKGIALDCPEDGIFYICPSCKHRIVIFKKEVDK